MTFADDLKIFGDTVIILVLIVYSHYKMHGEIEKAKREIKMMLKCREKHKDADD